MEQLSTVTAGVISPLELSADQPGNTDILDTGDTPESDHRDMNKETRGSHHIAPTKKNPGDTSPGESHGVPEADTSPGESHGVPEADTSPGESHGVPEADTSPGESRGVPEADTSPGESHGVHLADATRKETEGVHLADATREETQEVHLADATREETQGVHLADATRKETQGVHLADATREETQGVHLADATKEETNGLHLADTCKEETLGVHLADTSPEETRGVDNGDLKEGKTNESSGKAEPDQTPSSIGEREGATGAEEWGEMKSEKQEGGQSLPVGASGVDEASEEEESGAKGDGEEEESHTPATAAETANESPGAAKEEGRSQAGPAEVKQAESSETTPEEGRGRPAGPEEAQGPKVLQPGDVAQGCSASVEASALSGASAETEKPPTPEKKKPVEKKDVARSRTMPKSHGGQSRKAAIMEKFGGPATSAAPALKVQRSTSFGASSVKNMLLEWCKAKTRDYEHVDIQNFSSSWSSGMAFCALVHKFFPDEFDYATLDPSNRRQNFELAFSTAEKCADCAQLLEVNDMVRMRVPDSKCVYTYVQELYRSLVQMGLVKTKKQ